MSDNIIDCRTLWISDIHLGTRGSNAGALLQFLARTKCQTLYLVGDIIDCWHLDNRFYWPRSHSLVIADFLERAQRGVRVIWLPGNHDDVARDFIGMSFGGIEVIDRLTHVTADGRKLLVIHGDQFDAVVGKMEWLARLGDVAYTIALAINRLISIPKRLLRISQPKRSLSAFLKYNVKRAMQYLGGFEKLLAAEARNAGVDGVVCGHVHHAEIKEINGIMYCNDGDWVESCTAIIEEHSGNLKIIRA